MPAATGSRKPWWTWKSRGCAELAVFDIPFAVKEYIQNQVGQVLKEKEVREWSDWTRKDLRGLAPKEREECKDGLAKRFPGLMTGPHGASIARSRVWLPLYVLTAEIPLAQLRKANHQSDLHLCIVLWSQNSDSGLTALSFYNNHLDRSAHFSTFVVDGQTTSRFNNWAIGEKGKGFLLATQYLVEKVESTEVPLDATRPRDRLGVSFRVGNQVGEFKWKKGRHANEDDHLKVIMDDLTPTDVAGLLRRRGQFSRVLSSEVRLTHTTSFRARRPRLRGG